MIRRSSGCCLRKTARAAAGDPIMTDTLEIRPADYPLNRTEAEIGRRVLGKHRANPRPEIAPFPETHGLPRLTPAIGLRFWLEVDRWCRAYVGKDMVRVSPPNLTGECPWNKVGARSWARRQPNSDQVNERHAAAQLRTNAVRGKNCLIAKDENGRAILAPRKSPADSTEPPAPATTEGTLNTPKNPTVVCVTPGARARCAR